MVVRPRTDRFGQQIPPGSKLRAVGRVLVCTVCRSAVDVLEASMGARTDQEHQWIEADRYVCGDCTTPEGV